MKLQVFLALKGDPLAAREVLDRTVGKPMTVAEVADMERSEQPCAKMRGILEEEMRMMMATVPNVAAMDVEVDVAVTDEDVGAA